MELTFLELASSPSSGAGHPPNPSSLRPLYALHASRAPTALKHDRPPLQPFPSRLELNALLHALPNSQTSLPISPHPPRRLCARLYHPHSRDVPREGLRRLPRCEGVEHLGVGGQERQVAAWVRAVRASAAQVGRSGRGDGYLWRAFLLLSLLLSFFSLGVCPSTEGSKAEPLDGFALCTFSFRFSPALRVPLRRDHLPPLGSHLDRPRLAKGGVWRGL